MILFPRCKAHNYDEWYLDNGKDFLWLVVLLPRHNKNILNLYGALSFQIFFQFNWEWGVVFA